MFVASEFIVYPYGNLSSDVPGHAAEKEMGQASDRSRRDV